MQSVSSGAVNKYINEWELITKPSNSAASGTFTLPEDIDNFSEVCFLFSANNIRYETTLRKREMINSSFHERAVGAFHGGGYSAGQVAMQMYASEVITINSTGTIISYLKNWNDANFGMTLSSIYGRR